ncbi:MAG: GDP-mannose 4,6-dehydratase [Chloroflexi bacterium]|nr:GDP-mannose 4,6-dehydratase [Chloroflexota bacterium]
MKALITGISGFVGSHLAEYLLQNRPWKVAGTVYGPAGNIAHIQSQLELYPLDLTDAEAVARLVEQTKPDCIFHLAAQPVVHLSRKDPWFTLSNNIRAQLNILEAMVRAKSQARLLVIGSSEEYGLVYPDEVPVRETNPFRPMSPYAVSKIAQDMLGLQYFLSDGLDVVRVRPFNHIGPRQGLGFVAPDFAKQIAEAEAGLRAPVIRVGNLRAKRDFSDVRDVVRAYVLLMEKGESGEVYNVGSGQAREIQEVLDVLLSLARVRIGVEQDPERMRPSDIPAVVADCTRLRERTGWEPQIPFEQSLLDVLEYWRRKVVGR